MERDAERGVDWVHLPVMATVARPEAADHDCRV